MEYRPPDPACNGYLAFAAMLMAGLDGIENRIDPGEPIDKDLYDLPPEEADQAESNPGSLEEVLDALEADHEFLLKGDVFTRDVLDMWLNYKRKNEMEPVRLRPHPYDFHLYYDIQDPRPSPEDGGRSPDPSGQLGCQSLSRTAILNLIPYRPVLLFA